MYGFSSLSMPSQAILMKMNEKKESKVLATSAAVAGKKWDARFAHEPHHTTDFYLKCCMGGILSCGLTHLAVTPLDVAKCNMQVDPAKYKGLMGAISTISKEEGASALFKGWLPTLLGYSAQGCFKFGLYEFFKDFYSNLAGEEAAHKYRGPIYLLGSASAEFFADLALCPMEMIKVKVQTSVPGTFPTEFSAALAAIQKDPTSGFPFRSVVPLWSRQIPYTMAKFYFFEMVKEQFYLSVFTAPKETYGKSTHLGITFASGYIAGKIFLIFLNYFLNIFFHLFSSILFLNFFSLRSPFPPLIQVWRAPLCPTPPTPSCPRCPRAARPLAKCSLSSGWPASGAASAPVSS